MKRTIKSLLKRKLIGNLTEALEKTIREDRTIHIRVPIHLDEASLSEMQQVHSEPLLQKYCLQNTVMGAASDGKIFTYRIDVQISKFEVQ